MAKSFLSGIQSSGGSILDSLPKYQPTKPLLDDSSLRRRALMYTVSDLSKIPVGDKSLLEEAFARASFMEETLRIRGEAEIRKQERVKLAEEEASGLSRVAADPNLSEPERLASYQLLQDIYTEAAREEENMAAERRFVEAKTALLASGNTAEAKVLETLYHTPNAYAWRAQRLADREYMRKALEEKLPEEKDRNLFFHIVDFLWLNIPGIEETAYSGNVDTKDVEKGFFDWLLPGQRARNEAFAFDRIMDIRDPAERAAAMDKVAENIAASVTDFGYRNQLIEGLVKSSVLGYPRPADETNAFAALNYGFAPFAAQDALKAARGVTTVSKSAIKTLQRAGLRTDAAEVAKAVGDKIREKGAGAALKETGVSLEDVEDASLPSGLNPNATPGEVSLAGRIVDGPSDPQVVVRRLFADLPTIERLSPKERLDAELLYKAQLKKDFGRHIHDVAFDDIRLASGSTVISPVVKFGTTDGGLFVSKIEAEKSAARLGLESVVVVDVPTESGMFYAIEARLPISESQYYAAITDTKPKNFLWRFLLGSRQTTSDELYGMGVAVGAKSQKIVTNLEKDLGPTIFNLNNTEKKKLLDILVKSRADEKWYNVKELDMLWARQMGIGDDIREITDTEIRLGNIASPVGDPEFLAQKAFLDLKDRSAALGKQADDLFRNSGVADEATFWANASPEDKAIMDELTAINAQIAKGPQRVEIDTFLEPHTYKEWRAKSATPPPAKGMVRMYHGGVPGEGGRWATNSLEDARGWASRGEGMTVQYVDIPATDTRIFAPGEGAAEGFAPNGRFELTAEEMKRARVFKEGDTLFPPEHEELWKALDEAAEQALGNQAKAGVRASTSVRRAAELSAIEELRQATPHLDDFVEMFRNPSGVLLNEVSGIEGMPSVRLYGFVGREELLKLINQSVENAAGNGEIKIFELPGNRYVAWDGLADEPSAVARYLNDMLAEQGLPPIDLADIAEITIPVGRTKSGKPKVGQPTIGQVSPEDTIENRMENLRKILNKEEDSTKANISYKKIVNDLEAYKASGKLFTKRIKDAERRANKAMEDAMTGGSVTEEFRTAVDKALSLVDTKYLRNAEGQLLHTNRQKIMTKPMEWSEELAGLMPQKLKEAYYKLVDYSNVEHILRNDEAYLAKASRGFSTVDFLDQDGKAFIKDVDGIVYRAGSVPPVPASRVYNVTDDIHYVAKSEDDVKQGVAMRLTAPDINKLMKKEGYIMIRLDRPVEMGNRTTVTWVIGKPNSFSVKPLKFNQIGYIEGGHVGYVDSYFAKQVSLGRQGDNGETYLKNPHTFMVGTQAEVSEWVKIMEQARIIWKNTEDPARRSELLSNHLDLKPGVPSGEEFELMIKNNQFDPDYPVEALFDREQPSDYAKIRTQGWDDMSDQEESGINTYMQTRGRMYTSPRGTRLPDWQGNEAQIIDPFDMMNKSISNIASLSSLTDFKMRAINKWVETFGQYLDLRGIPKDASPVRIFQESVFIRDLPAAQKIKNSAEAQRETIKRILGWRSDIDREFEYMGRQLVSFVAGDKPGKYNKFMARGLEWATEKDPIARARKLAFHMYLGLGNIPQFLTQISTLLAATSINTRSGFQSFAGAPVIRFGMGLKGKDLDNWIDSWISKGWHKFSGFDDPEDFKAMVKTAVNSGAVDVGGSHSLINYDGVRTNLGKVGSGVSGEVLDAAGKVGKKIVDWGAIPFNEAETLNLSVGWQMAWRDAKKAGLVPGTSAHTEFVFKKQDDYTFNMRRAGQAAWQRGLPSIPTQFLSFQARMLEAMMGKQFTTIEKIRLVLGQTILYGTAGPPLLGFAIDVFDGEKGEAGKIGTWEGLVERGIIDTALYIATGMAGMPMDISYADRVATGGFISDTFRELFGMSQYGPISFGDVMGGPLWSLTKDATDGGTKLFWTAVRAVSAESGGDTGLPMVADSVTQMARNVASFNTAYKAYMVWMYGQYLTKSNKIVLDDLPSEYAFAVMLGLNPGEYRDYVVKQDWRKNRQKVVQDVSNTILEYRQRLVREPSNADAITSQIQIFRESTPKDIWADALNLASRSKAGESIYDGLARRYEQEKQQQRNAE